MKEIILKNGLIALVDDEDYDLVSVRRWVHHKVDHLSYAQASFDGKNLLMHRVVMRAKTGQVIDHRDGNGLNNQKSNLRFCTQRQNSANKRIKPANEYRGISWHKKNKGWEVRVGKKYQGMRKDKIVAAQLYDRKAKEIYGEYAVLNFK